MSGKQKILSLINRLAGGSMIQSDFESEVRGETLASFREALSYRRTVNQLVPSAPAMNIIVNDVEGINTLVSDSLFLKAIINNPTSREILKGSPQAISALLSNDPSLKTLSIDPTFLDETLAIEANLNVFDRTFFVKNKTLLTSVLSNASGRTYVFDDPNNLVTMLTDPTLATVIQSDDEFFSRLLSSEYAMNRMLTKIEEDGLNPSIFWNSSGFSKNLQAITPEVASLLRKKYPRKEVFRQPSERMVVSDKSSTPSIMALKTNLDVKLVDKDFNLIRQLDHIKIQSVACYDDYLYVAEHCAQPVTSGGSEYITIRCYKGSDPEPVWETPLTGYSMSPPAIKTFGSGNASVSPDGTRVIFTRLPWVFVLDTVTGAVIHGEGPIPGVSLSGSFITEFVDNNGLLINSSDGTVYCLNSDLTVRWTKGSTPCSTLAYDSKRNEGVLGVPTATGNRFIRVNLTDGSTLGNYHGGVSDSDTAERTVTMVRYDHYDDLLVYVTKDTTTEDYTLVAYSIDDNSIKQSLVLQPTMPGRYDETSYRREITFTPTKIAVLNHALGVEYIDKLSWTTHSVTGSISTDDMYRTWQTKTTPVSIISRNDELLIVTGDLICYYDVGTQKVDYTKSISITPTSQVECIVKAVGDYFYIASEYRWSKLDHSGKIIETGVFWDQDLTGDVVMNCVIGSPITAFDVSYDGKFFFSSLDYAKDGSTNDPIMAVNRADTNGKIINRQSAGGVEVTDIVWDEYNNHFWCITKTSSAHTNYNAAVFNQSGNLQSNGTPIYEGTSLVYLPDGYYATVSDNTSGILRRGRNTYIDGVLVSYNKLTEFTNGVPNQSIVDVKTANSTLFIVGGETADTSIVYYCDIEPDRIFSNHQMYRLPSDLGGHIVKVYPLPWDNALMFLLSNGDVYRLDDYKDTQVLTNVTSKYELLNFIMETTDVVVSPGNVVSGIY
jgi:hypothetical protein